jgi:hypothetical protein
LRHLSGLKSLGHLLTELRKKRWDRLSPREKYRVEANIGQSLERKGEFRQAAKHYIEAKQYQPQDDRARALEAIAYYHLDDKPKLSALPATSSETIRPVLSRSRYASAVRRPTFCSPILRGASPRHFGKKWRFCTRSAGAR